jgi:predicted nucleotidyltransferase component of viral defense system
MIKDWLEEYRPKNEEQIIAALREIMQEVALAGLSRTDFFERAAFYGGTALRIFYGLDRFSEDLDFSLLKAAPEFSLEPYFEALSNEFMALGINVTIREKIKSNATAMESAFLTTQSLWHEIVLENFVRQLGIQSNKSIKIKLEIDRNPPLHFETEEKLLIRPFSFYVKCFSPSSLFAGKLHALLYRRWNNRVKGRDWYDLEWYIKNGIPLDANHFLSRAKASGDWQEAGISPLEITALLKAKSASISFSQVKEDVARFIYNDDTLRIWSAQYFQDLIEKMKFV